MAILGKEEDGRWQPRREERDSEMMERRESTRGDEKVQQVMDHRGFSV